ncbi:MAG: hypothetical protein V1646_02765 [bacterium]
MKNGLVRGPIIKRFLSLFIVSILVTNIATPMKRTLDYGIQPTSQKLNQNYSVEIRVPGNQARTSLLSASAFAIAEQTLKNIDDINPETHFELLPYKCKEILYNEILKQAQLQWPNAWWNVIHTFYGTNDWNPGSVISSVISVEFSPDGNTLASGLNYGPVKIYRQCFGKFEDPAFGGHALETLLTFIKNMSQEAGR